MDIQCIVGYFPGFLKAIHVNNIPPNILHPQNWTWNLSIGGLGQRFFLCSNSSCLGSTVPFFSRLFLDESCIRTSLWNAWSNIWKQSGRLWVFGQRSKVELTKEMLQSLARNLAKIQYTPRKQTWDPKMCGSQTFLLFQMGISGQTFVFGGVVMVALLGWVKSVFV